MRRTLDGINAELSTAVSRLNVIHQTIDPDHRPDLSGESWRELEAELDRAAGAGDYPGARLAIRRWEEHARRILLAAGGDDAQIETEGRADGPARPPADILRM